MNQTAEEVVNELMMSTSFSAHFIVEGDSDRQLLCSLFEDDSAINVIPVDGCENVVDVMVCYESSGQDMSVLGIIDRDYRYPLGKIPACTNIVLTDLRDIECMMFGSDALRAVLETFGSKEKIRNVGGLTSVRTRVLAAAREIGCLRYYSEKCGRNIRFSTIELSKFVCPKTLSVDLEKMLTHIGNKQEPRISIARAEQAAAKAAVLEAKFEDDAYFVSDLLLCSGHDLIEVLSIALRRMLGSCKEAEVKPDLLERVFRVGYAPHFKSSRIFEAICHWLDTNTDVDQSCLWC